jgi:hypothetical protein
MYAKTPGLVAAGSYDSPIAGTTYQQGFVLQLGINEPLYGYKKGIQIQMKNGFLHNYLKGPLSYGLFPFLWIFSILIMNYFKKNNFF